MCGIAGIISAFPNSFSEQDVREMTSCLSHRGPDGTGIWNNEDSTVILGHNRLAVIDLSDAAAQPMHYMERYTIVHNGEVYNFRELREQLSAEGYNFISQSDTEVICAAYDKWKEGCLQYFDGMFAFAIWDKKERVLFAARDRFGEKPFYFYTDQSNQTLWFGSELKAFYHRGFKKQDYNGNLLLQYLSNGVSHTADSYQTFHKDILKLPARHYLRFSPWSTTSALNVQPYYDIDKHHRMEIPPADAITTFKELFADSVHKRLRSDVAIGTSLSGGLDSSAVIAAIYEMRQAGAAPKAFTASFPGFEKDETHYAALVTKKFSLQHFTVSPAATGLVDDLERFMAIHDQPVSSASVYTQYKVYQLAKQHGVKVILDGQGADEILAGYSKYIHWHLQELYLLKDRSGFNKEIEAMRLGNINVDFSLKNKLAARFPSWAAIHLEKKAYNSQKQFSFINKDFLNENLNRDAVYKPVVKTLNDILYADVFGGNMEELLRNADRNAMAHGIEARLPFLNHTLVEFAFSLPASFKICNGYSKYILRQSMDNLLPKEITWRKDKIGFEPPQEQWMQDRQLQDKIHESKKKLVKEKILAPLVLNQPIEPKAAHDAKNYDWRFLSAAGLF